MFFTDGGDVDHAPRGQEFAHGGPQQRRGPKVRPAKPPSWEGR